MTTDTEFFHRDGVLWSQAPLPSRLHRCRTWSSGWVQLTYVERCACGAHRLNHGRWYGKNSRRKGPR